MDPELHDELNFPDVSAKSVPKRHKKKLGKPRNAKVSDEKAAATPLMDGDEVLTAGMLDAKNGGFLTEGIPMKILRRDAENDRSSEAPDAAAERESSDSKSQASPIVGVRHEEGLLEDVPKIDESYLFHASALTRELRSKFEDIKEQFGDEGVSEMICMYVEKWIACAGKKLAGVLTEGAHANITFSLQILNELRSICVAEKDSQKINMFRKFQKVFQAVPKTPPRSPRERPLLTSSPMKSGTSPCGENSSSVNNPQVLPETKILAPPPAAVKFLPPYSLMDIWSEEQMNLAFSEMARLAPNFSNVTLDMEFPGTVRPEDGEKLLRKKYKYETEKYSVDNTTPIQIAFHFSALGYANGGFPSTVGARWDTFQFNLRWDEEGERKRTADNGIQFDERALKKLKDTGLDLQKHKEHGLDPFAFASNFQEFVQKFGEHIQLVVFEGGKDLMYALKLLRTPILQHFNPNAMPMALKQQKPQKIPNVPFRKFRNLPDSRKSFLTELNQYFSRGKIVDIKYLHPFVAGPDGGGLQSLSNFYEIETPGTAHQAGVDVAVTAAIFHKIYKDLTVEERNSINSRADFPSFWVMDYDSQNYHPIYSPFNSSEGNTHVVLRSPDGTYKLGNFDGWLKWTPKKIRRPEDPDFDDEEDAETNSKAHSVDSRFHAPRTDIYGNLQGPHVPWLPMPYFQATQIPPWGSMIMTPACPVPVF